MIILKNDGTIEEKEDIFIKKKKVKKIKEIDISNHQKKDKPLIKGKQLTDYCKNGKPKQTQLNLSKLGIMYRLNNYNLTYLQYIIIKLGISLITGIISLIIWNNILSGILTMFLCFLLLGLVFYSLNLSDNEDILSDICNIYTILNIDFSNNKYVNDCLVHIENIISNKRLKYAISELTQNIQNSNTTIEESLILFNNRFNSRDLEKLSIYLKELIKLGINEEFVSKMNKESGLIILDINRKKAIKAQKSNSLIANIYICYIIGVMIYWIFTIFPLNEYILS